MKYSNLLQYGMRQGLCGHASMIPPAPSGRWTHYTSSSFRMEKSDDINDNRKSDYDKDVDDNTRWQPIVICHKLCTAPNKFYLYNVCTKQIKVMLIIVLFFILAC